MDTRPVIFVSTPLAQNLSDQQRELISGILRQIESNGIRLAPEFPSTATMAQQYECVRRSHGMLVVALSQWKAYRLYRDKTKDLVMPSEFAHVMNAMAIAAQRPLLVLREKTVAARGSLRTGSIHPVVEMPRQAGLEWLETRTFKGALSDWLKKVREHRHVFLGYSSQARDTANAVKRFLIDMLQITVLDWHDFQPGEMIIQRIEEAERLTLCGIFLFISSSRFS